MQLDVSAFGMDPRTLPYGPLDTTLWTLGHSYRPSNTTLWTLEHRHTQQASKSNWLLFHSLSVSLSLSLWFLDSMHYFTHRQQELYRDTGGVYRKLSYIPFESSSPCQ